MFKKVLLNVFYNIGIFTMGLCVLWGFNEKRYSIAIAALFALALFVFFKVRLIKEVKQASKK
jgi:hypothetical protein